MIALTHAVLGLACSVVITTPTLTGVGSAVIGSLLPDIDHERSTLGKFIPLHWFLSHRGFTHSFAALLLLGILGARFLPVEIALNLVIGYASHLLADALNVQGEQLLWPTRKHYSLGLFRVGGIGEYLTIALAAIVIYLFGGSNL